MKKPNRADLYLPRERLPAISPNEAGDAARSEPAPSWTAEALEGGCRLYRPDFRRAGQR